MSLNFLVKKRVLKQMKYKIEIMEMARLACATVPDDLQDQMDISDDYFIEIRDYLERVMNADENIPS